MNDLEAIVRLHSGFLPLRARQNIEIALDSHPLGSHFQMLKERFNAEAFRNFTKLAVDDNFHGSRAACNLIRGFLIGWLA